MSYPDLARFGHTRPAPERVAEQVEIDCKYETYLERHRHDQERRRKWEAMAIPGALAYHELPSLSREAADKLSRYRPATVGQSARIPGLTASDLAVLTCQILRHSAPAV